MSPPKPRASSPTPTTDFSRSRSTNNSRSCVLDLKSASKSQPRPEFTPAVSLRNAPRQKSPTPVRQNIPKALYIPFTASVPVVPLPHKFKPPKEISCCNSTFTFTEFQAHNAQAHLNAAPSPKMCSREVFARAVTDMLFANTITTYSIQESRTRVATPLTSPLSRCVPSLDDVISWTPIPSASETAKLFSPRKNITTAVAVPSISAHIGELTPVKATSSRAAGQASMPHKRREQHGHVNTDGSSTIYGNHFEEGEKRLGSIFDGFDRVVAAQRQRSSKKNLRENLGERTPPSLRKKNTKLIFGGLNSMILGGEGDSSSTNSETGRQRRLSITSVASSATVVSGKNLKISKKTIAKDKKMMVVTAAADALRILKMRESTVDSDVVATGSDDSSLVCLKKKVTRISNLTSRRRKPKRNEDMEMQDSSETADDTSKLNLISENCRAEIFTPTQALEGLKTPVPVVAGEKVGNSFANAFLDVLGDTATSIFGESDQGPNITSENSNTLALLTSEACDDEVMQYVMMMIGTPSSSDAPADRVDSANFLERGPLAKLQSSSSSSSSSSSDSHAWTDLIKFDFGDESNSVVEGPSSSASTVDDMFFDSIMSNSDDLAFLNEINNPLDMLGWNTPGDGLSSIMPSPLKFNANFIPDFISSQCNSFPSLTMDTDVLMTKSTRVEEDEDEKIEHKVVEDTESLTLQSLNLVEARKPKKGGRKPSGDVHYECLHPGCDKKYASKTGLKYHLGVHKRDNK
ncbi:hypothetical protein HK100_001145, partial [Physocladia obscura]